MEGTFPEIMRQVEQRFLDGVARGQMHEDIAVAVSEAFVNGTHGDLLTLMVLVRGLHSAAEAHRSNGDAHHAGLLHSLGQDLLAQAVDAHAANLVAELHQGRFTRH